MFPLVFPARFGWRWLAFAFVGLMAVPRLPALEPIPDKLVVLTFDDSVASHHAVVAPLLKKFGFGATFFITEGFGFRTNKQDYLTWGQIAALHRDGFEIGNHSRDHLGVSADTLGLLRQQLLAIEERCAENGIPRPTSFGYPGNSFHPGALPLLAEFGYTWARRGGQPEFPYEKGEGRAYEPGLDHALLIPTAGDARPFWTLAEFRRAAGLARQGRIAVLQFHGVPDRDHPWVHTPPERFTEYVSWLAANGYRAVALRDLARYVDPGKAPERPMAAIEERQARPRVLTTVVGRIVEGDSEQLLPARLYLRDTAGTWYFPDSQAPQGSAIAYQRRSGASSVEMHTTLSADPFEVRLPPGHYTARAERGPEWLPGEVEFDVGSEPVDIRVPLRHWAPMNQRGWFSGDGHNHRSPADLPNVQLAEDLNVALPMVYWTTVDRVSPQDSPQNMKGTWADPVQRIDATHAWFARNSEYEIFSSAGRSHTQGALLVLNHKTVLDLPAQPIRAVVARARAEGALLDLEKHNWPWSMPLVPLLKPDLFELANNHHWQTEFGVRSWALGAPAWMQAGAGNDTERNWTLFGFRTWYALLNCGFSIAPSAGTANGVHPVPLGFSRVYVHQDGGFDPAGWLRGLKAGHSFVTTGPMLLAQVNGTLPGTRFRRRAGAVANFRVEGEILSEQPHTTVEIIADGEVVSTESVAMTARTGGGYRGVISGEVSLSHSGWLAVRAWEAREAGRFRFAHTGAWHVRLGREEPRPRREEIDWLVKRCQEELERNRPVLPAANLREYEAALAEWQEIARRAR